MKFRKTLRYWAFLGGIVGIFLSEVLTPSITFSQGLDEEEINTIFEGSEPDVNQRRLNQPSESLPSSDVDLPSVEFGAFDGIKVTDLEFKNADILGEKKEDYINRLKESLVDKQNQNLYDFQAEIERLTANFSYPGQPFNAAITRVKIDEQENNLIARILEISLNQSNLLDTEGQFWAKNIRVEGSTVFSADELDKLTELLKNRRVNLASLEKEIVARIEAKYNEQGFLSTRATVANVALETGNIVIRVFEDQLEIKIEGNKRLSKSYIRSRVMRRIGKPLNWNILDEQIQLLKADPLIDEVISTRQAGRSLEQTALELEITEAKAVALSVSLANSGGVSTAPERATYQISHSNLTGLGDKISFQYRDGLNLDNFNRSRSNNYQLSYAVPFNALGGKVEVGATNANGSLLQSPGTTNEFQQYNISLNQPLIKTPKEEVILGLRFRYAKSESFDGRGRIGDSSTRSVLAFSQTYDHGNWNLFSQLNFGLPILGATDNPNPQPDGEFFSWNSSITYKHKFAPASSLTIKSALQIAADPLLGGEQLFIGGFGTVRGYRQGVRRGDNGLHLSVQGKLPVVMRTETNPLFSVSPYFELGYVWNHPDNPNSLDAQRFLAGSGLGLLLTPTNNLALSLFLTIPLVDLDDRGNNIQDDGIYFSLRFKQPF